MKKLALSILSTAFFILCGVAGYAHHISPSRELLAACVICGIIGAVLKAAAFFGDVP